MRRLRRDLVTSAVILAIATALFVLGSLAFHGRVAW